MGKKAAQTAATLSRYSSSLRASRTKIAIAVATALSSTITMRLAAAASTDAGPTSENSTALDEIVVTARKRTENLQDVPISMDVFSSKDLQNLGISQFEDYATITPSISFVSAGPGTQTIVMRETSARSDSPTVSETILMLSRRKSEATRVRTPGLSCTKATKVWSMSIPIYAS